MSYEGLGYDDDADAGCANLSRSIPTMWSILPDDMTRSVNQTKQKRIMI